MALTRVLAEARLIRAHAKLLQLIGASVVADGNHDLCGDALEAATLYIGYAVANLGAIADADLAAVPASRTPYLMAVAAVELKKAILGSVLAMPTEATERDQVNWSDVAKTLRQAIADGWKDALSTYAVSGQPMISGRMAPKPQPPDAITESWLETG